MALRVKKVCCRQSIMQYFAIAVDDFCDEATGLQTVKAQEKCVLLMSNIMHMRLQRCTRNREEFLFIQLDLKNN